MEKSSLQFQHVLIVSVTFTNTKTCLKLPLPTINARTTSHLLQAIGISPLLLFLTVITCFALCFPRIANINFDANVCCHIYGRFCLSTCYYYHNSGQSAIAHLSLDTCAFSPFEHIFGTWDTKEVKKLHIAKGLPLRHGALKHMASQFKCMARGTHA